MQCLIRPVVEGKFFSFHPFIVFVVVKMKGKLFGKGIRWIISDFTLKFCPVFTDDRLCTDHIFPCQEPGQVTRLPRISFFHSVGIMQSVIQDELILIDNDAIDRDLFPFS